MATISLRTAKGSSDYAVTFANPGTAAPTADIELNINTNVGGVPWEPQELRAALARFEDWLDSNQAKWRGL